jgi:hypothetical protein
MVCRKNGRRDQSRQSVVCCSRDHPGDRHDRLANRASKESEMKVIYCPTGVDPIQLARQAQAKRSGGGGGILAENWWIVLAVIAFVVIGVTVGPFKGLLSSPKSPQTHQSPSPRRSPRPHRRCVVIRPGAWSPPVNYCGLIMERRSRSIAAKMGTCSKSKPSHRPFRSRPRWRNPGRAWEPRTKSQELKHRTPRAFSIRGEWKYGHGRTEEREKQLKKSVGTVISVNRWIDRVVTWLKLKLFGIQPFRPERIDPDIYIVEVE